MVKISAVLPAYNVEKYLGQCIESIINQNIECEIIIVNDGSTDNTLSVAESYKEKYPFIKVFSQENCGQSTARNKGIENATGEYLLLLDSDDYLCPDTLNNLYDLCKQNDLDYIRCGWNSFVEGEEKSFLTLPKTESINKVISSKKYFCELIKAGYNCLLWNGIIKRQFLTNIGIKYFEGIQYEDNLYALQLYLSDYNAKVMQTDIYLTNARLHSGTTTSSKPKLKKITDILKNVELMDEFIETLTEDIKPIAKKAVSSLVFALTNVYFRLDKKDRKKANKLIPKKVLQDAINYPYDNFQKKKVYAFLHFRPILTVYNCTLRKFIAKKREKKRLNG